MNITIDVVVHFYSMFNTYPEMPLLSYEKMTHSKNAGQGSTMLFVPHGPRAHKLKNLGEE